MNGRCEIAIVGGGIVGAALAALTALRGQVGADRIVLLDPDRPQPPRGDEPLDLRVSAFSPASIALLEETGAWQRLDRSRLADYERMVIWPEHVPADSPDALVFEAAELGEARLGVIAENRAVQAALLARCEALGIRLLREKLVGLEFGGDVAVLTAGAERLEAALVVGADGANSAVRAAAAIPAKERSYGQQAIVATVRATRPRVATAFQCFLSTGPLALLPLPDGCYSIVWSATEERARELLALDEAGFNAALTAASDGVAGSLALASPRAAFALRRLAAQRYVAPGCVLVGDAAHVIHPLAGQGVNQGLLDVAALVAALAQRPAGESAAALRALRRYERERRSGNALMGAMVDAFDRVFSGGATLPARIAGEGMALVNRSALARRFFVTQAAAGRSSPRR